jgi:hypothetical protein
MWLDAFQCGELIINTELLKSGREQYNPNLTKGWMHSSIGRHLDVLQERRSFPLEYPQLTVPREQLKEHIHATKTILAGKFSGFVSSLDEVGSSDWEECKPKKIITPGQFPRIKCDILSPEDIAM